MKHSLVFLLLATSLATAEEVVPTDAASYAAKIVASHGGKDKLLRTFQFTETYLLAGRQKGTDRTSILQPPHLWYVGQRERVSGDNKGGVCHDVWMWTLAPLTDPSTIMELIPGQPNALRLSGTMNPPMDVYFDPTTDDLVKIEWKGERFLFSSPVAVDGTRVPSKAILIGKSGKERMRTELRDIQRMPALPADLPKPETIE